MLGKCACFYQLVIGISMSLSKSNPIKRPPLYLIITQNGPSDANEDDVFSDDLTDESYDEKERAQNHRTTQAQSLDDVTAHETRKYLTEEKRAG
jgi:hypothetical protein